MKRIKQNIRQLRRLGQRVIRGWRQQDRRWGLWWRAGNGLLAAIILAGVVIPIAQQLIHRNDYTLSADTLKLVGTTDQTLTKQLTYDAQTQTYQFNQAAVQGAGGQAGIAGALAAMRAQVGTASGHGSDKSLYALAVPQDFAKGVTYTDTNTGLNFSLVPQFSANTGQAVGGHLVFPVHGSDTQAIYTLKNNGLKEDIVVQKATGDTLTFSYKLSLPTTLEAKVIPGSNGSIGIYSADPSLYGNISYGGSTDQASVQRARVNSPKTNLVFGLPSPVIKNTAGQEVGSARFVLQGDTLQVVASDLSSINTPFTIDPSVVVTAASDFSGGNNEDNIDFSTSGQITRGGLTGGSISAWATATSSPAMNLPREGFGTVVDNGYMYAISGSATIGAAADSVEFAPINASTGAVGPWHYTGNNTDEGTTFVSGTGLANGTAIRNMGTVLYNGYIYITGGDNTSGTKFRTVEYAKVNSDGTLGPWHYTGNSTNFGTTATNVLTVARSDNAAVAYNGYLYVTGGCSSLNGGAGGTCSSTGRLSSVEYAPINADGTVGTFSLTSSLNRATYSHTSVAYNGYIYVMGGCNSWDAFTNCNGDGSDVEYAPINANGTVGTWHYTHNSTDDGTTYVASSGFSGARRNFTATVYGGYIYIAGGDAFQSDVQYAPLNASGTVGAWQSTNSFTTGRRSARAVVANGRLYLAGGCAATSASNCSSYPNDVQVATIDPAGVLAAYQTNASSLSSSGGLWGAATVAYGGYLYVLGGSNTTALGSDVNTVYYAKLNTDGSVGSWASTAAFTTARIAAAAVAYNGYMYLVGGYHSTSDTACSTTSGQYCADVQYAAINANGTLGTWASAGGNFSTTGRYNLGAVAYNGYVYVMGGDYASSNISAETDVGQIQSNGTVSGWTTTGNLVSQTSEFATAQAGPYVYVLGGRIGGGGNYNNTVEYAILNNSGTVSWATTSTFTNGRANFTGSTNNGYVYIYGGAYGAGTSLYSDTQYARICMDTSTTDGCNGTIGTLGTWHTTASFTTARMAQMGAIYNGYLYVMGGCSNQGLLGSCASSAKVQSDVQYAPINNGGPGTAGTWKTTYGSVGLGERSGQATVAYNGYMYALGGYDGTNSSFLSDVKYTAINSDGTFASWQTTNSFTSGRTDLSAIAYNGYMYVMGGDSDTGTFNDVQYAPINANGSLGTWQYTYNSASSSSFASGFTNARYNFGTAAYKGYLYIIGGEGSSDFNDVQYAPINANGTVGTWNATTSFTGARSDLGSLEYNGYLYILGGLSSASTCAGTGSSYQCNDVQYAPINANGTVGTWNATTSLGSTNYDLGVAAYDGYLYLMGGGNSPLGVRYAPISASGALGNWQATTSFTTSLYDLGAGSVAYKGYLYALGDYNNPMGTQYAPLNSIARVGHYSKLIDLGSAVSVTGVTYNGTPGGAVSVSYRAAGTNGVFGSTASVGTISSSGCTSNVASTRYLLLMVTLDDSYGQGTGGSFPDSAGTLANLTDLTINYSTGHPPPNIRLRGGQTLQAGTLSPLDTCS